MRTLYTFIACSLFSFALQAQTFVYSTDQHIDEVNYSGSFDFYDINFTTQLPQEITYEWTQLSNSMPIDWTYSLCDYTNCYVGVPPNGTMTTITLQDSQNGIEGFFKLTASPLGVPGEGLIEIYVFDSANPTVGDTVSFNILYEGGLSVSQLSSDDFTLYPNPASNVITIQAKDGIGSFNGVVINTLGQRVQTLEVLAGMDGTINVSSWEKGMYILRIESESGIISTRKFIVE